MDIGITKLKTHEVALVRIHEVIAEKIHIQARDLVLDAGCGLGGTALWLAQHIGCRVVGVSITPDQIQRARAFAHQQHLDNHATFQIADYTHTTFPDHHFDVVVAIETVCHLEDKTDFYKEMYRLLKPGGKLVVAEYILSDKKTTPDDQKQLARWLSGWHIPNLWTEQQHMQALTSNKFHAITIEDYSKQTIPSSRRMYFFSLIGIPVYQLLHWLKIIPDIRLNNAISCYYQWRTKKKGLWRHKFIIAKKPRDKQK